MRRPRIAISTAWLILLVLFALLDGAVLVESIVHYGRENRAPAATLTLAALALVAALVAMIAVWHRVLRRAGHPEIATGISLTATAVLLLLLAGLVSFAAGPH